MASEHCEIGVVFALALEARPLVRRLVDRVTTSGGYREHVGELSGRRVAVIEAGVGPAAAARATEDLLALRKPRWIVSTGLAGGLAADLDRADVIVGGHVVNIEGQVHATSAGVLAAADAELSRLVEGRGILSVAEVVARAAEKARLAEQTGAAAVDMETFAVANVCSARRTRFLAVRAISDTAEEDLPRGVSRLLAHRTAAGRAGAAAALALRRPSLIKDLWRLRRHSVEAAEALADVLARIVAALPETRLGPPP